MLLAEENFDGKDHTGNGRKTQNIDGENTSLRRKVENPKVNLRLENGENSVEHVMSFFHENSNNIQLSKTHYNLHDKRRKDCRMNRFTAYDRLVKEINSHDKRQINATAMKIEQQKV